MWRAPRYVCEASDSRDKSLEDRPKALQDFRDQSAWVLLGEPGAGKSTAFEAEAEATGGLLLSIADFMHAELDSEWQGKALFLDGLDEVRAGSAGDSVLVRIRTRLKQLGNPKFRIACRAADWFGSTDRADIEGASPDGQIVVLQLEPLGQNDIIEILRTNHDVSDPDLFVETAGERGVAGLLDNPQTLSLLAQAITGSEWPGTRQKTFQLACEKLAEEANKRHRKAQRGQPIPINKVLDAAGQLCAVLLLSDKTGLALDLESANERFPRLEDFSPPDMKIALQAVSSKLFRRQGEERFVPSHRSVAEYLAANWLAQRIDAQGLPLGRALNLLLGQDGRTVAGLRGLYGWLALHCHAARARLIEADPLTVVVYGDVKPMPSTDKRLVLQGLREEARRHVTFRWQESRTERFGDLAAPDLADDFITALESPERDDAAGSFVSCVLDILVDGSLMPGLASTLKRVVLDETRVGYVRKNALRAWLKQTPTHSEALVLLDAIAGGQASDPEDELAGLLLGYLYPEYLEPQALLSYLHVPKSEHLIGSYAWFWEHTLPKNVPKAHLPGILDGLAETIGPKSPERHEFHLRRMIGRLLAQGIELHGEEISDERLFTWLGMGADEYGEVRREEAECQSIAAWLEAHPDRYKSLLVLCFARCESDDNPWYCISTYEHRLHRAMAPADIGLWHLERASQHVGQVLTEIHLGRAVSALMYQRGAEGLSLETLEAWGDANPERKARLDPLLFCEIQDWRIERAGEKKNRDREEIERRRESTKHLNEHVEAIRSGTATSVLLHQLAGVWMDLYTNTHGDTPLARFDSYCENGKEILEAAEAGFRRCPERVDLPSVAEIIDLGTKQREHYIRKPCLVGMELRWQEGPANVDALSDDVLSRMLAFRMTYGSGDTPAWFTHLVAARPVLVADVLVDYATMTFKSRQDFVDGIYPLENDPNYCVVARLAVPRLLGRFPLRARSAQLHHLETLLKSALRYTPDQLPLLIALKTGAKGMDVAQKVYWLSAGMLLDPDAYEAALWDYIGESWARANHVSEFLSERFSGLNSDYRLSARTIGKLIELLAPHAELEWRGGGGFVNDAMRRGDHVRAMVTRLGTLGTDGATGEIERLLSLPALKKLKLSFEDARHQVQLKQRESAFQFPPPSGVAQILANKEPTSSADLAALALDYLDDIAQRIRRDNDDGFRSFWNVENKKPTSQREENLCRDALLTRLRACFDPLGVDCQPEGDYANDKRADLRLSFRNEFELPVEIKRDSNDSLWSALKAQLIDQYSISPKAAGYGIYLVLWFGGESVTRASDGGKKPRSPEELKIRLEAQLDPVNLQRIFVRVIDVSWPVPTK